ncbi:YbfB/YjiJ family MFS transporter [Marinobacter sp. ELB17]|uniref:YbfB/YjiJ family MFS transporter n=1 Tax=Marinobacter sp. ELB17 TaxID=270374 RepID=UPI0000F37579|nr:YbfB/YjiJ family MFS transporter [Marinobacter sp. ELB17]EBA00861.1 putative transport protein (MFS superfamily) [Marinobacter sp. ELB17]
MAQKTAFSALHSSPVTSRELFTALAAGAVLLLVVHALGRFMYTPLLPYLVNDGLFSAADGAAVATWNYMGYLMGAVLAIRWHRIVHIRRILPLAVAVHIATTVLVAVETDLTAISTTRWLNGVANGVVFVQAPALILEWLVLRNRASLSGLVYFGVGFGLLLSAGVVSGTADWLEGPERWWPAAVISVPLASWGTWKLMQLDVPIHPPVAINNCGEAPSTRLFDRASTPLFLAYAGAGLGYILPMTFLPLLANVELKPGHWLQDGSWLLVALCTIPAPWIWNRLGAIIGDILALKINFAIQLAGVLAAVVIPGALGLILCAILVGVTFLGTVLLTQRIGRALHPHQGPRLSAAMVALYGFTQMVGPWLTKQWLDAGGTLASAFGIGVGALLFGWVFVFFVPRPDVWHSRSV